MRRRLVMGLIVTVFSLCQYSVAYAYISGQQDLFSQGINYFDTCGSGSGSGSGRGGGSGSNGVGNGSGSGSGSGSGGSACCSGGGGSGGGLGTPITGGVGSGKWAWSSNAQPPYYLEEFIINILQDLAQTLNVPQSSTVTQEHVVALVAWTQAEGGNIANSNAFNPWNMGFLSSHADLYAGGGGSSDGSRDSFASFNDGVEGNTILFTTKQFSRIATVLSQPNNTAEDVLHSIAYYDQTPGNEAWAWGPNPNDPSSVLQFNHTVYINSLLGSLSSTRKDYGQEASVVIGPNEENTHHVPVSNLSYSGGQGNPTGPTTGSGGGSSGSGSCGSGSSGSSGASCPNASSTTGDAKILCEAQQYNGIWYRYAGGHQGYSAFIAGCPDPSNPPDNHPHGAAIVAGDDNSGNPSPCATDCSGLVSIATDEAFNQNYMWVVEDYVMQGAGAQYWHEIPIAQAQPGDIVTLYEHVEIVDHVSGSTIYTFGSHETGTQTGEITSPISYWDKAYRWTGPGSGT